MRHVILERLTAIGGVPNAHLIAFVVIDLGGLRGKGVAAVAHVATGKGGDLVAVT